MGTCEHLPEVPECCLQEQQCWSLCFQTPGLHLTSELSVEASPGTSAVSLLAGSASEISFLTPSRFSWDYAFVSPVLNCLFL